MADLPVLPDSVRRKLALRWNALLDAHQLTGDHLHWHERENDRLVRVAAQYPSAVSRDTDEVGIPPSVTAAEQRFDDLVIQYRQAWILSGDGYESFADWLQVIKREVGDEIARIWKGGPKNLGGWYKRACAPAVEDALQELVEKAIRQARADELRRLEGGHALTTRVADAGKGRRRWSLDQFPNRAQWLRDQLEQLGWSTGDLNKYGGPDHKTAQRMLDGKGVRNDVLKKVADALTQGSRRRRVPPMPDD